MTDGPRKPASVEDFGRLVIGMMKRQGQPKKLNLLSSDTPSGLEDIGFENPMTDVGDLMAGGESGEANRIGVGTDDQVLTADSTAPLGVAWKDATGSGSSGRYRAVLYELDGSGSFDFLIDEDGHPIYELTELE